VVFFRPRGLHAATGAGLEVTTTIDIDSPARPPGPAWRVIRHQARHVAGLLASLVPGLDVTISGITTTADQWAGDLGSHDAGHGQNALLSTPAQGFGMLGSWGSGSITVRVCCG
jgi:hypothetical protein